MSSSNKTASLLLPQFSDLDKPTWRGDLNDAFFAIDGGYVKHTTDIATNKTAIDANTLKLTRDTAKLENALTYGADPTGVADSTAALTSWAAAVKAARILDTPGNYRPGAIGKIPPGTYSVRTLTAAIQLCGDIDAAGVIITIPDTYAGSVFLIGGETGAYLVNADMTLPDVVKTSGAAIVAGSEGYRTQNLGNSVVRFGKVNRFERGIRFTGDGQGTVYNQFYIGWISGCKIALSLKPHTASGWTNSNTFIAGGVQCSVGTAGGTRIAGYRHVELDGSAGNSVNANTFVGTSFEGDAAEYWLSTKNANDNVFIGTRHELGTLGAATTIAGDTLTTTAHGLAVGSMVAFTATTAPAELFVGTPYYVVTVVDANNYKVGVGKGAPAVVFSTNGSGVSMFRPPAMFHDMASVINVRNVVKDCYTPMGFFENVQSTTAATGNGGKFDSIFSEKFAPNDTPVHGARNSSSTAPSRPIFAAYAPGTRPYDDPKNWVTALSDRGVVFAASRAETGLLSSASGILQWRRPADTQAYQIPSGLRSASYTTLTGISAAANTTTVVTLSLVGAASGDFAVVTPQGNLVAGLAIAYARVSAADTVTVGILNTTAAAIDLSSTGLEALVYRRYF